MPFGRDRNVLSQVSLVRPKSAISTQVSAPAMTARMATMTMSRSSWRFWLWFVFRGSGRTLMWSRSVFFCIKRVSLYSTASFQCDCPKRRGILTNKHISFIKALAVLPGYDLCGPAQSSRSRQERQSHESEAHSGGTLKNSRELRQAEDPPGVPRDLRGDDRQPRARARGSRPGGSQTPRGDGRALGNRRRYRGRRG